MIAWINLDIYYNEVAITVKEVSPAVICSRLTALYAMHAISVKDVQPGHSAPQSWRQVHLKSLEVSRIRNITRKKYIEKMCKEKICKT